MNTDNQPTPDDAFRDAWQQAFDEAAETPPPRVWNAIERQLDAGDRVRVVPLWTQARPWLTGIAATVALLLTGWWAMRQGTGTPTTQPLSARTLPSAVKTQVPTQNSDRLASGLATTIPRIRSGMSSENRHPSRRMAEPVRPNTPTGLLIAKAEPVTTQTELAASTELQQTKASGISRLTAVRPMTAPGNRMEVAHRLTFNMVITTESVVFSEPALNSLAPSYALAPDGDERSTMLIRKLPGKPFRNHALAIQRVVWFRNDDPLISEPEQSKPETRKTWASLSVMPSVFDPATAVRSAFSSAVASNAYSLAAGSSTSSPAFSSQSGGAITVQAAIGKQLTDRWSVEAGVGYLQARSTVISPVQAPVYAGAPRTLYEAVVGGRSSVMSPVLYDPSVSQDKGYVIPPSPYSSGRQEQVRNDYTYVQMPVQVGYQLRPRRRLGLSLLGGLLTNWFVRNNVGDALVVKPGDGVFRPLTVAGTAGARFRYRSSRRWSASLAGVYQQSLQSGTLSDVNLTTRPQTIGVSVGMDYHF